MISNLNPSSIEVNVYDMHKNKIEISGLMKDQLIEITFPK